MRLHFVIYILSLLFIAVSCNVNRSESSTENIENQCDITLARKLQDVIMHDTINIDSLRLHLDNGADPNCVVRLEYEYYKSRFPSGSMFDQLFGIYKTKVLDLTALHALFHEWYKVNNEEALYALLKAGADPNIITKDSILCINQAMGWNTKFYIFDSLIAYGADPSLINLENAGTHFAAIDYLINLGANPKTIGLGGFVYRRATERVNSWAWRRKFDRIMEYDIDPQKTDPQDISEGWDTFNTYALDRLLEKGLDLNKPIALREYRIKDGYWLQWALDRSHNKGITKYIIQKGAIKCKEGVDPYELAKENKMPEEILELLKP